MSEPERLTHCPKCGGEGPPSTFDSLGCGMCGFGTGTEWSMAVLAELSRQALELRTHGRGLSERHVEFVGYRANLIPLSLQTAWSQVLYDYEWIGKNPPELPGMKS